MWYVNLSKFHRITFPTWGQVSLEHKKRLHDIWKAEEKEQAANFVLCWEGQCQDQGTAIAAGHYISVLFPWLAQGRSHTYSFFCSYWIFCFNFCKSWAGYMFSSVKVCFSCKICPSPKSKALRQEEFDSVPVCLQNHLYFPLIPTASHVNFKLHYQRNKTLI